VPRPIQGDPGHARIAGYVLSSESGGQVGRPSAQDDQQGIRPVEAVLYLAARRPIEAARRDLSEGGPRSREKVVQIELLRLIERVICDEP
jgi:hypothetical protein